MLSSYLDALLKLSKTTFSQKLFDYDCVTLYNSIRYDYNDAFNLFIKTKRAIGKNTKQLTGFERCQKRSPLPPSVHLEIINFWTFCLPIKKNWFWQPS